MKNFDIKNNCSLPFAGMQIDTDGRISPCCMYKEDLDPGSKIYNIKEYREYWNIEAPRIQKPFLNGSFSPGCDTCFDKQNEITSGLRYNATLNFLLNHADFIQTNSPEWLDIRFGNYCNLKCIMCHGILSSQIYNEQHANYSKFEKIGIDIQEFKPLYWWDDPELLNQVLELTKKARYISFSGGEPLLSKELYTILDSVNPDCIIDINTNLTKLTDRHIEVFKTIKDVKIHISLDGIGPHLEYVRYGSSWDIIETNIKKLLDVKNIEVIFAYLLQHTSVYSFPKFYEFIKDFDNEVILSTVYSGSVGGDEMMTINSVPEADVEQFRLWCDKNLQHYRDNIYNWINMYKFNPVAHNKFKNYVNLLDELRGCNFQDTFNPSWKVKSSYHNINNC